MERNPQDSSPNESDSEEVVEYTIKLKPAPDKPKYYNPPLLWKKIKYKSEFQPEGLHGHSQVRWTKGDKDYLYIYGGSSRGWSSDRMYRYDIKLRLWERVTPVGEALHVSGDHTGVVYRDHMLVFGGRSHADRRGGVRTGIPQVVYNQLYLYSFETNEWRLVPTEGGVIGRKSHSCVIYEDVMYVFGGWDHKQHFNDMWRLPLHALFEAEPRLLWEIVDQRGEVPRKRHTHSTVVHGDEMLLFGGAGGYDMQIGFLHFNEIDKFNFKTHTWSRVQTTGERPMPAQGQAVCYTPEALWCFGGHDGETFLEFMFKLDLKTWQWFKCKSVGKKVPNPRACCSAELLEYNPCKYYLEQKGSDVQVDVNKRVFLLFGGYGPKYFGAEAERFFYEKLEQERRDEEMRFRLGYGGPPVVPDPNTFVEDEWHRYNEMYFAFIDLDLEKQE
jgi:hypothetical protein